MQFLKLHVKDANRKSKIAQWLDIALETDLATFVGNTTLYHKSGVCWIEFGSVTNSKKFPEITFPSQLPSFHGTLVKLRFSHHADMKTFGCWTERHHPIVVPSWEQEKTQLGQDMFDMFTSVNLFNFLKNKTQEAHCNRQLKEFGERKAEAMVVVNDFVANTPSAMLNCSF